MQIQRIEINNFGKLKNFVLEPDNGLNLVYGRNEDGKSTVMAFLRMMFYGNVGSSKDVSVNARKKYRPWDGAAMGGSVEFTFKGTRYRLQKRFGQTAGRDETDLFDMDSGTPVRLKSGEEVGTHFFGMSLEGFERSMFIGRSGGFSGNDGKSDGITERLINLTTSSDENVSLKKTLDNLNDALEGLVSKRGNSGLLVRARERAAALDRELRDAKAEESSKRSIREEFETLITLQASEKERLEKVRERRRRFSDAADDIVAKRENLTTLERRTDLYRAEKEKREEIAALSIKNQEERIAQAKEASEDGKASNLIPLFAVLAVLALGIAIALAVLLNPLYALITLVVPVFMLGEMSAFSRKRRMKLYREAALTRAEKLETELEELLEKTGRENAADEKTLLRLEKETKDAKESLKRAELRRLELSKQVESDDGLEDKIIAREQRIAELRAELSGSGRPLSVIVDEREEALNDLSAYEEKYEALKLAIEVMEEAGEDLRLNFGPVLNIRTAEIFGGLTGGKYTSVNVSKDFGMRVLEAGDAYYHEGGYLSNGTVDQAYFALRLAIAELLTESENEMLPLLLDDVFEQYDDIRTSEGLHFLEKYAKNRGGQVILFTCHGRVLDTAREETDNASFFRLSEHYNKKA